ncbi:MULTISPECIES: YitT family protein [unclassified Sporosarcina]|uniref:YitT family protein n=1 Tax=unclassified Sporosarcina TaxID=2647733 RepID=UPI0020407E05|nr:MULTISPECIES: YitT family protein [unclassified Sporosarcina]
MERGGVMVKMVKQKHLWIRNFFQAFMVVAGSVITAYGLESVLIPNKVSDGGVTGLSIVGSQLFGVPLGMLIAVLNIPFIILGYFQIGRRFAVLSVIGIAALGISTSLMHHVPIIVQGDALLVTVVGGIIIGIGIGLALRNGGALDGIDMLAVLLSRRLPFATSDLILFLNIFVFIIVSFVFGLTGAIMSAIAYFIASKVISIMEVGLSGSKAYKIMTDESEAMIEEIRIRLGHSATYQTVQGGYSNQNFMEITCIIHRLEDSKMKEIIRDVDKHAYVAVYDVAEFKRGNLYKNRTADKKKNGRHPGNPY